MDPNKNLSEQIEISHQISLDLRGVDDPDEAIRLGLRLAELVLDMNEWLGSGGFLPKVWDHRPGNDDMTILDPVAIYGAPLEDSNYCPGAGCAYGIPFGAEIEQFYKVILLDFGPNKMATASLLRNIFGYTALEALNVVNNLPKTLVEYEGKWQVKELREKLESVGALVLVK